MDEDVRGEKLIKGECPSKKPIVIYMGDDRTDEDAFQILKKDERVDDFLVYIRDENKKTERLNCKVFYFKVMEMSAAQYFLKGTEKACEFLERIYEILLKYE